MMLSYRVDAVMCDTLNCDYPSNRSGASWGFHKPGCTLKQWPRTWHSGSETKPQEQHRPRVQ